MSIDRRILAIDNDGGIPCIDPLVLGRVMDRICSGHTPSLVERITKALAQLRKKLAR